MQFGLVPTKTWFSDHVPCFSSLLSWLGWVAEDGDTSFRSDVAGFLRFHHSISQLCGFLERVASKGKGFFNYVLPYSHVLHLLCTLLVKGLQNNSFMVYTTGPDHGWNPVARHSSPSQSPQANSWPLRKPKTSLVMSTTLKTDKQVDWYGYGYIPNKVW